MDKLMASAWKYDGQKDGQEDSVKRSILSLTKEKTRLGIGIKLPYSKTITKIHLYSLLCEIYAVIKRQNKCEPGEKTRPREKEGEMNSQRVYRERQAP